MTYLTTDPIDLAIDRRIAEIRYGKGAAPKVHPQRRYEQAAVATLLDALAAKGWNPVTVECDGDVLNEAPYTTPRGALEDIFNLDDALVRFAHAHLGDRFSLVLILGNGPDILSDYHLAEKVAERADKEGRKDARDACYAWDEVLGDFRPEEQCDWEVRASVAVKDAEIAELRARLYAAQEKIRGLQSSPDAATAPRA